MRGAESNPKTGNTVKRTGTTRDGGTPHNPPPPPFNGTTTQTKGGHHAQDGGGQHSSARPSITMPPTIHNGTPPSATAPPTTNARGRIDRGYPTTRTAQTRTHHPHTTHLAMNGARYDSSTRQHCNGMSRARATPLHWAGQQHTPPPFHTPRRMDTIHSSTHLLSLIHVHTTNEQQ